MQLWGNENWYIPHTFPVARVALWSYFINSLELKIVCVLGLCECKISVSGKALTWRKYKIGNVWHGFSMGQPRALCLCVCSFSPLATSVVCVLWDTSWQFPSLQSLLSLLSNSINLPQLLKHLSKHVFTHFEYFLLTASLKISKCDKFLMKFISILMHKILNKKNAKNWHYATALQSVWEVGWMRCGTEGEIPYQEYTTGYATARINVKN